LSRFQSHNLGTLNSVTDMALLTEGQMRFSTAINMALLTEGKSPNWRAAAYL